MLPKFYLVSTSSNAIVDFVNTNHCELNELMDKKSGLYKRFISYVDTFLDFVSIKM